MRAGQRIYLERLIEEKPYVFTGSLQKHFANLTEHGVSVLVMEKQPFAREDEE